MHAPVIEVKGLTKRFGRTAAVDRLDFAVSRGEIFGLCGPNGAGKTTILRILCGLLTPTEGEVRVAGTDSDAMPRPPRPRLGYMTEKFSLYGELSVAQNLHFFAAACKIDRSRRRDYVTELLAEHGLASYANKRAAMLPAAAKQLLSLAVALVSQPEIVLLDEPTVGVDPLIRRDIWRRAERLAGRGVTVIVASENMDEMPACDRLLLLYRGQCIAIGGPDELLPRQAAGDDGESTIENAFISFIEARKQRDVA
jgi:ABC-2 type transport system ATP-binding protein